MRGRDTSGRASHCCSRPWQLTNPGGFGYFQSVSVVQLGEAYLLADQVEDARACADRAVWCGDRDPPLGRDGTPERLPMAEPNPSLH
jgi:hypothetical protein